MSFSLRPYRRFPVQCSVTYHAGPFQGQGTVWNLSCTGWRLSGDLPMRPGEPLSVTVTLPNEQRIEVPESVVAGAGVCGGEPRDPVSHPRSVTALRQATGAGTSGDCPVSDNRSMSLRFPIALVLSIICLTAPAWAEVHVEGAPTDAVRTTVNQALRVLRDEELKKPEHTDERVTQLRELANSRFDYGEMAKRSLGGQWDKLGARDREEFVALFTELLTATYAERIHAYTDEEVTFLNERVEGDHAEVKTVLVGKKTETPMNYRLMKKNGDWKAYDVVVDGISLVSNYRGQFTAILRASSYAHLVEMLRDKIAQYHGKPKMTETIPASR